MLRVCRIVSILVFALGGAAVAQDAPSAPPTEERTQLISELDELARFCVTKRLGIERNRICETILRLDPDHENSHRRLKHVRRRGQWQTPSKAAPARNQQSRLVPEVRRREREILARYCEARLRTLDDDAAEEGEQVPDEVLRELLDLAPDYAPLRLRLGERQRDDGQWVLVEGLHAKLRRQAMFQVGAQCLQEVPTPKPGEVADWLAPIDLRWTALRKTPRVTVGGTVDVEEIESVLGIAHASQDFFNKVFSTKQSLPPDLWVLLLSGGQARDALIDGIAGLSASERERYRGTGGARFPGRPVVGQWLPDARRRADGTLRHCLGMLLERECGIYTEQGWIWEGFGLCLTHRMIGTRLTYFIQHTDYVAESSSTLLRDLSTRPDWLQEALEMLESPDHPTLAFVVGKNVNQMTLRDVLYAHALAAYLLDGRPDVVGAILRTTGAGTHPLRALEDALGTDAATIEARLTRWLRETR